MHIEEFSHTELKRFPQFELSYETISHKKISQPYDICIAIPFGKKVFLWMTFRGKDDVCFLLETNKDKKIIKSTISNIQFHPSLALGTVLYGTIITVNEKQWFICEDIYFYKGVPLKKSKCLERLAFTEKVMLETKRKHASSDEIVIMMPVLWKYLEKQNVENAPTIPEEIVQTINYSTHHVQYRSSNETMPYLNVIINKKLGTVTASIPPSKIVDLTTNRHVLPQYETANFFPDFVKPQYKTPTVFHVTADIQYDIYHLFAYGKNKKLVYYNVAYIPNYNSSVFMNDLFRNIRENKNLDYIEESDDEEEFQKTEEDRYVDLKKNLLMECQFNYKFKRWVPKKVVHISSKVVHIENLVKYYR
jgi:hypothetical protein